MRIVSFPEVNTHYTAPEGYTDKEVQTLPAFTGIIRYTDGTSQRQVISCWELSAEELAEVQRTGRVWLSVWGEELPPVAVDAFQPFRLLKKSEEPPPGLKIVK